MDAQDTSFDTLDRAFAVLRVAAVAAGLSYAFLALGPGAQRGMVLELFAAFAAYSLGLYAVFRRVGRTRFYVSAAVLDFGFSAALIAATGGVASPFVRALFIWVAMLAFCFGRRAGTGASLAALAVLLGFDARAGFVADGWTTAAQAAGLLMHGPLIGFLTDRERRRARALREAHDRLAEANRRIVEEQSKLVQAEKLSSIGLLASGVAHEVNNPLAGVMGCVRALREGAVPPERRGEYFETIRDGLERIRATVQGLLDFSRQRPPSPTEQDAHELAGACLRLLAPLERKKDLEVVNRIAPGAVRVRADRTQLMQAMVNVLMNAIQAVPRGGHIEVAAREAPGRVGLEVADDGVGISREAIGRVCDPFFTTKPPGEGTGLGLAITVGIARAHGGDLTIDSEVGRGTRVTLWLPATEGTTDGKVRAHA